MPKEGSKIGPYKRRGSSEEDKLILYKFHAVGTVAQVGEIKIVLDEPPEPTESPTWGDRDAQRLYAMLRNYFPGLTVGLIGRMFLTNAHQTELIKELERRMGNG